VSYDGMGEPLGRSQVLTYLLRLAPDFDITLVSFEKRDADLQALREEMARRGIRWFPRRYHHRPPVLSTLADVLSGVRIVRRCGAPGAIIHVRSYVPALIALLSRRGGRPFVLFDIRGFWADERVEGGLWEPGGVLYRLAKRCERWFFAETDAVVTLTEASVPQIRSWTAGREIPVVVIPTCVDLERFVPRSSREDGPRLVWSGSIGTWYRFDLAPRLASAGGLPLTVITRQTEMAKRMLGPFPAEVFARSPPQVAGELHAGDIGLCLIRPSFSKTASAPTRFAEFLAAGMPVISTAGVGDLDQLVEENGVGVLLHSEDDADLGEAVTVARGMAADPQVRKRCRALARERFDVEEGSRRYAELYRQLIIRDVSRVAAGQAH
jgi:glycosyltransferase involved in cell wall biosynthesis